MLGESDGVLNGFGNAVAAGARETVVEDSEQVAAPVRGLRILSMSGGFLEFDFGGVAEGVEDAGDKGSYQWSVVSG